MAAGRHSRSGATATNSLIAPALLLLAVFLFIVYGGH